MANDLVCVRKENLWPFRARSEPEKPVSSHPPRTGTRVSSQEQGIVACNSNLSDIFSKAQQKMHTVESNSPWEA